MDNNLEKNNKLKAFAGTVLFHAVLATLLFFLVLGASNPPMFGDDAGVEVNFGTSDQGMGALQPDVASAPDAQQKQDQAEQQKQKDETPAPPEKIVTQEVEEAPVISRETKTKPKKAPKQPVEEAKKEPVKETSKPQPKKEEVKQPVVNPNALYKGKKTANPSPGNEGETGKSGDQGIKEGSLYAKTHGNVNGSGDHGSGTGADGAGGRGGKGVSYNLSGRNMVRTPEVDDKSQETGKVVVAITVDQNGNVTKATPGARGSTTTNGALYAKAQQAAMKAKFNPNPEAAEEQKGTITFVFIVQ